MSDFLSTSSIAAAGATAAKQTGQASFSFDPRNTGNFLAGAAASGVISILNTPIALANVFNAGIEEIDTVQQLKKLDVAFGTGFAPYYSQEENKQLQDVVGFIGTMFAPGTLAVKGLNAMKSGRIGGSFETVLGLPSSSIQKVAGFAERKAAAAGQRALDELVDSAASSYSVWNKNKLQQLGWNVLDDTITGLAFELGVMSSMAASPVFQDDTWGEIGSDALMWATVGGIAGGALRHLSFANLYKQRAADISQIGNKLGMINTMSKLGGVIVNDKGKAITVGLTAGDQIFGILDELAKLPTELIQAGIKFGDKELSRGLDVKLNVTQQNAMSAIAERATAAAKGDATLGIAISESVRDVYAKTLAEGGKRSDVVERLMPLLVQLEELKPIGEADEARKGLTQIFVNADVSLDSVNQPGFNFDKLISTKAFEKNKYAYPVFLREDVVPKDVKLAVKVEGKTVTDLFKEGADIVIGDKGVFLNRSSDKFKFFGKNDARTFFFNARTGTISDNVVATVADTAGRVSKAERVSLFGSNREVASPLNVSRTGVSVEGARGGFYAVSQFDETLSILRDAKQATARAAYLAKYGPGKVISEHDVHAIGAFLEPDIANAMKDDLEKVVLTTTEGEELPLLSISSLSDWLTRKKLDLLEDLQSISNGEHSIDEIAYRLNTSRKWVEEAIAKDFQAAQMEVKASDLHVPLAAGLARENVAVRYSTVGGRDLEPVKMLQLFEERKRIAVGMLDRSAAVVLGKDFADLPAIDPAAVKQADTTGTGAGFVSSAVAGFKDTLRTQMQFVGAQVAKIQRNWQEQLVTKMSPALQALHGNADAAAEFAVFQSWYRGLSDRYRYYDVPDGSLRVVRSDLFNKEGNFDPIAFAHAQQRGETNLEYVFKNKETEDVMRAIREENEFRIKNKTVLANARGVPVHLDPNELYLPPVNTKRLKHFAFVKDFEGKLGGTSDVGMLFSASEEGLRKQVQEAQLQGFNVIFKKDTEDFFKAQGLYDSDRLLNTPQIDSALRRKGVMTETFSTLRAENITQDLMEFYANSRAQIVRDAVENKYAQIVEELKFAAKEERLASTSIFSGGRVRELFGDKSSPYEDYVKVMLNISKQADIPLVRDLNEIVDAAGTRAYAVMAGLFDSFKSKPTIANLETVNKYMQAVGLRGVYTESVAEELSQRYPKNLAKMFVSSTNAILANVGLRFDFAQSIINAISAPLLISAQFQHLKQLAKADPAFAATFGDATSVLVPDGSGLRVPTTFKLFGNGVTDFFKSLRGENDYLRRFQALDIVPDQARGYVELLDTMALTPELLSGDKPLGKAIDKIVDVGSKFSGNQLSETFSRYLAANTMRQLVDPAVASGKMTRQVADAYIHSFANLAQGNLTSSQRPLIFQGTIGAAIGLFQTYQFNLLQQLTRFIGDSQFRALATAGGLQAGLFGFNGLPFFEAINTHLIGNAETNEKHHDAYSTLTRLLGKDIGEWLLYGTASAFPIFSDSWPSLYTRGDINPRHMTIVPTNPLDVPSVAVSMRVASNLTNLAENLFKGAPVKETVLEALEHNGLNRPLAGFAQIAQGYATTSSGSLISEANEVAGVWNMLRLLGTRPQNEAVLLNHRFRQLGYQAADRERIESLGEAVKKSIRAGNFDGEAWDSFMLSYVSAGGRVENYNQAVQRWIKNANQSVVQELVEKHNTEYAKRLFEIAGGDVSLGSLAEPTPPADEQIPK